MPRYLFFFNHDKPIFKIKAENKFLAWGMVIEKAKNLNCHSIYHMEKLGFKIMEDVEMFNYTEEELAAVQPRWRDVLIHIDHNGLSYDEYAQANDIKLGTVKSRVHRARAKVREMRNGSNRNASESANVA